jgi:hypothetical protein
LATISSALWAQGIEAFVVALRIPLDKVLDTHDTSHPGSG